MSQGISIRRPIALAVGLALVVTLGLAQPATADPGTAQLGGQLTDFSGNPVSENVHVKVEQLIVNSGGHFENVLVAWVDVDGEGNWTLPDLDSGTYRATAAGISCGHCYATRGWSADPYHQGIGDHFDIAEGESRLDLDIRLFYGAHIGVDVVALPDDPTNVIRFVGLEYLRPDTGDWQTVGAAHITTGSYMSFSRNLLLPGTYRLTGDAWYGAAAWTTPPVTLDESDSYDYPDVQLVRTDILTRSTAGSLLRYELDGTSLSTYTKLASGWGGYNQIVDIGDFNEDGYPDLLARDSANVLWLRPGIESRAYGPAVRISSGWSGYVRLTGAADMDSDGHTDLVAQGKKGALYLFSGNGDGTFQSRKTIGSASAWSPYVRIAGGVDFDQDGNDDIIAKSSTGNAYVFTGNGNGGFDGRIRFSTAWSSVQAIAAVGHFDNDEYADIAAITSAGSLVVWRGGANSTLLGYVKYATGWKGRLIF